MEKYIKTFTIGIKCCIMCAYAIVIVPISAQQIKMIGGMNMVNYNNGRFIFKFDLNNHKLSAVYDSKYEAEYTLDHVAFEQVFEIAVKSLETEVAKELRTRLKAEPKYANKISRILYNRENNK